MDDGLSAAAQRAGHRFGAAIEAAVQEGVPMLAIRRGLMHYLVGLAKDSGDMSRLHDDLQWAIAEHCD